MLIVETLAKIRFRYHIKKQSIKQICRELKLARNTVRKAIKEDKTEKIYQRTHQVAPKLEPYVDQLETWLKADDLLPKSQRCSAVKLFERLKDAGYSGAYDSVQRFVKSWLTDAGKLREAYIPLSFSPGEAYQFDWSEEIVELGGVVQKVKIAHFRLCYSRLSFVVAYPRETQEMLFDAHEKAFSFLGGMTVRGIYDNMKTAVDTVFIGKERIFNRRFIQMMSHYLIEPTACTPASGWEKGQVENQVNHIRQWFFTPRLKFKNLNDLNIYLKNRCLELAQNRKHPEQKERFIWDVYQEEKSYLKLFVRPFDGYIDRTCKVSGTCLIHFDRNRYSVDCHYAYQAVSLRIYASKIIVLSLDGKMIAEHERCFGRDKVTYDPWHYVPLLERKPGALRNGAPFKEWNLPASIEKVCQHLMKRVGGDKQCVHLLQAIKNHGLEEVAVACELAISDQVITSDYILNLLNRLKPTCILQSVPIPDKLRLTREPEANCFRYNALLKGGSNVTL